VLPEPQRFCQEAVGKAGATYAKLHVKAVSTCLKKIVSGDFVGDPLTLCRGTASVPPTDQMTADRLATASSKVLTLLQGRCTDADVAALDLCDVTVAGVANCLVDDAYPVLDTVVEAQFGAVTAIGDPAVEACQTAAAKGAAKYLTKVLKTIQQCINTRNKKECPTDAARSRCLVPTLQGTGDLRTQSEQRVLKMLIRAQDGFTIGVGHTCTPQQMMDLPCCTSAGSVDGCKCSHDLAATLLVADQYRSVRKADPGTGIQAVLDQAEEGDSILVETGTYTETAEVKDAGLTLIGLRDGMDLLVSSECDAGARAVIESPNPGVTPDGMIACGSHAPSCANPADDLLIKGLEVHNFEDNAILVVGMEGVTIYDVVTIGDGTNTGMEYGPFPILSNNVQIAASEVAGVRDAGIYVGQSTNIEVIGNHVHDNVAGIEIENSANARVLSNHAHDNTGGILVFKLPGLGVQLSNCVEVVNNIVENNNTPNFGSGTVGLVPRGTGILILSGDSVYVSQNTVTGNETFGLVATDQFSLNVLNDPDPFPMLSPDAAVQDNFYVNNTLTGNGTNPDPAGGGFSGDFFAVLLDPATSGNCGQGNTLGAGTFPLPACTRQFPAGCPLAITPSTTVTSTTVSTTTTSTSTTLPASWAAIQAAVIGPTCGGCHGGSGGLDDLADCNLGLADMVDVPSLRLPAMDRIEPGDSANSWLVHKLDGTHTTFEPGCTGPGGSCGNQMPLGGPFLAQHIIDSLKAWIDAGAPNDCPP
jgi:parallel beta-helix repeat protein